MTKEQMDKYAYELMVKNNPEEAVKNLLLKDDNLSDKALGWIANCYDSYYKNEYDEKMIATHFIIYNAN